MTVTPSASPPSPLSIPHVHTQTNTLARILTGMQVATCYSYSVPSSVSTSCPDQFLSMWSQGVCADMTVQVGTEWVAVVSGPRPYLFSQNTHASKHALTLHACIAVPLRLSTPARDTSLRVCVPLPGPWRAVYVGVLLQNEPTHLGWKCA